MNNNKSDSYQKIRSLYEQKYFSKQLGEKDSQGILNRIKFMKEKRSIEGQKIFDVTPYYSQEAHQNAQEFVQSTITNTSQTYRPYMSIEYTQMQRPIQSVKHYRRQQAKSGNRLNSSNSKGKRKTRDYETILFPNTSRQLSPNKLKNKKYSLIQMIDQIKKLKETKNSQMGTQRLQKKEGQVFSSYKSRNYTQNLKSSQYEKRIKNSVHYKTNYNFQFSAKFTSHSQRQAKRSRQHTKDHEIDAWIVNESEYQNKKFF